MTSRRVGIKGAVTWFTAVSGLGELNTGASASHSIANIFAADSVTDLGTPNYSKILTVRKAA